MGIEVVLLGLIDYGLALDIQDKLMTLRQSQQTGDILLLLEHPPVITLGKHADPSNILIPRHQLDLAGIKLYNTNRGGDVTYHGPGQIVGYTIFNLNNYGRDIKVFVRKLEEVAIQLLKSEYNIIALRDCKHTGVWVGDAKIMAIGLAVKRWVTMHGFALNVNTPLEFFKLINPCGIVDKDATSLAMLTGRPVITEEVIRQVITYFCNIFELQFRIRDDRWLHDLIGGIKDVQTQA